jgi:hypothetical protein
MNNVQLMTINNTFYLTELKSYGIKILQNVIFLNIFSHSTYLKSRCTKLIVRDTFDNFFKDLLWIVNDSLYYFV